MNSLPLPSESDYQSHLKPKVASLLQAVRLDKDFHKGEGDYLWYWDANGCERQVLDLVGGFGSTILGHNHPTTECKQKLWIRLHSRS